MEKEQAIDILANKSVNKFTAETPLGHTIKGWMCRARNHRLGSMVITHINGEEKPEYQLVQSFPKITYLDDRWKYKLFDPSSQIRDGVLMPPEVHSLEKRDGTCAIFYPLWDKRDEEVIEVVPKTREMPVMAQEFQEKIKGLPETEKIKELVLDLSNTTVCGELFGIGNIHEIPYGLWDKELCIEGIGMLDWGRTYPWSECKELFDLYNIPTPFPHLEFARDYSTKTYFEAETTTEFIDWYDEYLGDWSNGWRYRGNLREIYNMLENELYETILKNAKFKRVIEGSVWHYGMGDNGHFLKNKALSVRQAHILRAGCIQPQPIRHALLKAKEEFSEQDFNNFPAIIDYVNKNLMEDFEEDHVLKSQARIKSLWGNIIKPRNVLDTSSLQAYLEEIHKLIGEDADIADKMRKFAEQYPDMRKTSRMMYQAFLEWENK